MTIPLEKSPEATGPKRDDRSGPADGQQTSLARLTTYAPSVVLLCGYLYGRMTDLAQKVHEQQSRLDRLGLVVERQYRRDEEHLAILAACQRDTASVVNRELQQQALYPAVEAVAALAAELLYLQDSAKQLVNAEGGADSIEKLRQQIVIGGVVATERLAHIDARMIAPRPREQLDPREHVLRGSVETGDADLHGKISQCVTTGLVYRGKVLCQARVIVFRRKTSTNEGQ